METHVHRTPQGNRPERHRAPGGAVRGTLYRLLRWVGTHVRGFHGAVGTVMLLALAAMLAATAAFAELAEWVGEGKTQAFDTSVLVRVHRYASPALDRAALEITALGAGLVVVMLLGVASVLLWISRHRYSVLLLWVAVVGATLLNTVMKAVYDRPRPSVFPWRTPYAEAASFPSGHSTTAVAAYATLAYLVARLSPTRRLKWATIGVAVVVILLIGLSRVYLGVHYPSDVLAGFLSGFVWAVFCALGIEVLRYFRRREPEVEEREEDLEAGAGGVAEGG
jgi:undecaprenyl-diphosphatase